MLCHSDLRGTSLTGANLTGTDMGEANLRGANFTWANLSGADMREADIRGANLTGAVFSEDTILETGERLSVYQKEVIPALLTAGGRSLADVLSTGCWKWHDWGNCPIAVAFRAKNRSRCPVLLQPRILQFIQLFDANLLTAPEIPSAANIDNAV